MNLLKFSWKNIVARPLSSGLSILLLCSGISIILITGLAYTQIKSNFESNGSQIDLVVGAKGSRLQSILCNVFHVDKPTGNINYGRTGFLRMHPFIEKAIPISLGDNYKSYRIVGTTSDYLGLYGAEVGQGEMFKAPMECVVGSSVAKKTGLRIGDKFAGGHGIGGESTHSHDEFQYKVVGILDVSNTVADNLVLTGLSSVWIVHLEGHEGGGSFDIHKEKQADSSDLVHEGGHEHHDHGHHHDHHHGHHHVEVDYDELLKKVDPKTAEITAMLVRYKRQVENGKKVTRAGFTVPGVVNNTEGLMAADPAIELHQLMNLIEAPIGVISFMAGLVVLIACMSMFISMINSLKDRKYEIAVMRSLGASPLKIFTLIILEGVLLSVLGFVFAACVSHGVMELLSGYLSEMYHYDFTGWLLLDEEWLVFVGAVLVGIISALYPAIRGYRVDISETLSND